MPNPAKPTKLKELAGNPGGRPLNPREPKPKTDPPVCPEWLSDDAKETWSRVLGAQAAGVILAVDTDILTAYCEAVATFKQAQFELRKAIAEQGGLTVETERGWVTNPCVNIADKAMTQIRHLGSQMGLTPSSRSKIVATPGNEDNDADKWLSSVQ